MSTDYKTNPRRYVGSTDMYYSKELRAAEQASRPPGEASYRLAIYIPASLTSILPIIKKDTGPGRHDGTGQKLARTWLCDADNPPFRYILLNPQGQQWCNPSPQGTVIFNLRQLCFILKELRLSDLEKVAFTCRIFEKAQVVQYPNGKQGHMPAQTGDFLFTDFTLCGIERRETVNDLDAAVQGGGQAVARTEAPPTCQPTATSLTDVRGHPRSAAVLPIATPSTRLGPMSVFQKGDSVPSTQPALSKSQHKRRDSKRHAERKKSDCNIL